MQLQSFPGCNDGAETPSTDVEDLETLTNQSRLGFLGGGLKETGAKMERFRRRVSYNYIQIDGMRKICFYKDFFGAFQSLM